MDRMTATARLHSVLGRASAIAAKYGHDEMAADFAAAQARVAALRVVRLRQINRVPGTMPTMPARARPRRITTARAFAHRRGVSPRGQESGAVGNGIPMRRHAAHPQPVALGNRARTGRPAPEVRDAGAQPPTLGGRYGRGGARPRDGPAATG